MSTDAIATPTPEQMTELQAVTDRARAGDHTAVPRLRELLALFPRHGAYFGDLALQAAGVWIDLAAGPDLHLRESLAVKLDALRRDLLGGSADPVLDLAVDRVALTWLAANYLTAMDGAAVKHGESPRLQAFRAKRRHQAERAHLTALAALVALRKALAAPPAAAPLAAPVLTDRAAREAVANRLSGFFDGLPTLARDGAKAAASN
ncbi:Uncharacterized protein OS=Planctomyces maris DSM 8797 GN=PM8797T_31453 PE=4 SV=1 [Gemmataceae bacterium]|nr:Uncharacterized protein OS=Planctomyces maris DSM 8797 GN=PM8797T_31453 PE=4 SV=1 [Gemmataceae bacterium]VTU00913.1 Uncharacterized protein OS=Planctomyces maris DSM 8797 GN=PM8797T_31453 PE=4 SV=1 [Gemmataceae bacterium]